MSYPPDIERLVGVYAAAEKDGNDLAGSPFEWGVTRGVAAVANEYLARVELLEEANRNANAQIGELSDQLAERYQRVRVLEETNSLLAEENRANAKYLPLVHAKLDRVRVLLTEPCDKLELCLAILDEKP